MLRTVEAVAATGAPTVVMTYWNPVERYGVERFAADLADAGGAGLITPDLTPDSAEEWIAAADAHDLDKVFLVAPSSTDERCATPSPRAAASSTRPPSWASPEPRDDLRSPPAGGAHPRGDRLPIGVGLGVSNGAQAAEVAAYADG